jgi:saccharopepsin
MEVKNQIFESVTDWWPYALERADLYDTALGLALLEINETETTLDSPSLFQSMIHQGLISENLFTLRTARTDDEIGELTLGSTPDYINEHELVHVPLTQNYNGEESELIQFYASSGWQVALNDLTISHNDSTPHSVLSSNSTAILSTSFPWILLPWDEAKSIWAHLGFTELVPCEERFRLPNVTFTFGPDGQEITLTPWDYLLQVYRDASEKWICQIMFGGAEKEQLNGFVILGSAFFNGLYSVWDADRKMVSLANRPR